MLGVSVVVCCHNSAALLPDTLRHLAAQRVDPAIPWEVLVIDNASSDATRAVAEATWPAGAPARLRIVAEPRLGLGFARERGRRESCWPIISFIDDDNWVGPDWVRLTSEVMNARPAIGAAGGFNEAVFEASPPFWFETFAHCYAVGAQGASNATDAGSRQVLWGAGMNVRREAWDGLVSHGFKAALCGRRGGELGAGDDSELCLALRLAGWELWYDPRLRLRHFLPARRLEWSYLRRVVRGFGAALLDPYWQEVDERQRTMSAWRRSWAMTVARELRALPTWWPGVWRGRRGRGEGDAKVLDAERALGRCGALLGAAGDFSERCRAIRDAPWRGNSGVRTAA
jgi:glycosyltransferase involved in cell wall biosynthesis